MSQFPSESTLGQALSFIAVTEKLSAPKYNITKPVLNDCSQYWQKLVAQTMVDFFFFRSRIVLIAFQDAFEWSMNRNDFLNRFCAFKVPLSSSEQGSSMAQEPHLKHRSQKKHTTLSQLPQGDFFSIPLQLPPLYS